MSERGHNHPPINPQTLYSSPTPALTTITAAIATATAATATAVSATAAATTATRTLFAWASFVHGELAAAEFTLVETVDGGLSFFVAAHFDESKTFASARVTIRNHLSAVNIAKLREQFLQVGCRDCVI